MTVCIAAICESGNAVVVASDRFAWLTHGFLETELDGCKFTFLNDRIAVLAGGTTSNSEDAIIKYHNARGSDSLSVRNVASRLFDICQELRLEQAESLFVRRPYGMSFVEFQRSAMGADQRFTDVYRDVSQYQIELSVIVAGVDSEGAHLHVVTDRANNSFTDRGFAAVGTGTVQALIALSRREQKKSHSLAKTLYNVYEAKRHSELAQGVGPSTDIAVIRNGRPKFVVPSETLRLLDDALLKMRPPDLSQADEDGVAATLPSCGASK